MEDQVMRVKSSHGFPRAPDSDAAGELEYFVQRTIRVVPQREIVVVLSGSAYDWRRYTAFYVWRLKEDAGRTYISIDGYAEAELSTALPDAEFAKYHAELDRNWQRSWTEALGSLEMVLGGNSRVST
jgi:hypothetical protein